MNFQITLHVVATSSWHFGKLVLFQNIVLTTEVECLKPNRHFSKLAIQEVTVSMVTKLPFCI